MTTQAATRNYYDVLGVPHKAKLAAIRRRYVTLTQEVHPDRFGEPAEKARKAEEFKWINEAWQVLSDPAQRGRYDSSLEGGTEFSPAQGEQKTIESIFNDAKRFKFSYGGLPESLNEILGKYLKSVKEFDHRVIATFPVRSSTVGRSPLTAPCGVSQAEYLILTNMFLSVGIVGDSETQKGNTKYTMTYSRMATVYLGDIDQLDIGLSFASNEDKFRLRIHAPESPFSGIDFECSGSPFVFLWIADLFDIRTRLSLRPTTSASLALPIVPWIVAGCAMALGGWIALNNAEPLVIFGGLALAGIFAIHGWVESLHAIRGVRLVRHAQTLVKRLSPQRNS